MAVFKYIVAVVELVVVAEPVEATISKKNKNYERIYVYFSMCRWFLLHR